MIRRVAAGLVVALVLAATAGCSAPRSPDAIKVVYLDDGNPSMVDYMAGVTRDFQRAHPAARVDLQAVKATAADYYTKVALMNRSPSTAPDVIYEDSFQLKADASAGYLEPLDRYLARWDDWPRFIDTAREGGEGEDGKQYGVPTGTDVQVLWYRKDLLRKAGVEVPWRPRTWDEVLAAARKVKEAVPDVVPMNLYASRVGAEATSVRGVQTLLSGTDDELYEQGRWVTSSPGFSSTLGFIRTLYGEGLAPTAQTTADPNYSNIPQLWLKDGKLAIASDGSFISTAWVKNGSNPWPEWGDELGVAAWPTEDGGGDRTTTMSGGWTFAMGSRSAAKDLAFDYISTATNRKHALAYAVGLSNIPVRDDVTDAEAYTSASPTATFFASLLDVTHFRPTIAAYPQVSDQVAIASDAVSRGDPVARAVGDYGTGVRRIVGDDTTTEAR